jgi:protein-disulfide isomerase
MKPVLAILFAALLAPVLAFAGPAAAAPRAAAIDWTRTVTATPDGGLRMGNPNARVKLVEYFSFTCPHCAAFAGEAYGPLTQKYVRTGQVSFELRAALRDPMDMTAALSARCTPTQGYFGAVEDIMAAQADWETKAADWIGQHSADLNGPDKVAAMRQLVTSSGLEAIAVKHGAAPAAMATCLDDKASKDALEHSTNDAWNVRKIGGTPGFLINNAIQSDVFVWSALEPKIQAALKG